MMGMLDEATEPWGIKVERVEIKDARLPMQLQVSALPRQTQLQDFQLKFKLTLDARSISGILTHHLTMKNHKSNWLSLKFQKDHYVLYISHELETTSGIALFDITFYC
jgi:hypothetical protein